MHSCWNYKNNKQSSYIVNLLIECIHGNQGYNYAEKKSDLGSAKYFSFMADIPYLANMLKALDFVSDCFNNG